jgi:hypothetical protein
MSNASKKAVKQQDAEQTDLVDFPRPDAAILDAWAAYWRTILACQKDINEFLRQRLRSDIALEGASLHSHSMLDLVKLQQRWVMSAAKNYFSEWMKLTSPPDVTTTGPKERETLSTCPPREAAKER